MLHVEHHVNSDTKRAKVLETEVDPWNMGKGPERGLAVGSVIILSVVKEESKITG